jgi:hypothetical protein
MIVLRKNPKTTTKDQPMKLVYKIVPPEFLTSLPDGIKYVQKQGQDFLVVEQLFCPDGHSLMADHVRLHGEPSICLEATIGNQHGRIFVDAFWGGHDKLYSFIPTDAERHSLTRARCPHCGISLMTDRICPLERCGSPQAIALLLPGGVNRILVCARLGCPDHELVIQQMPEKISRKLRSINYFGKYHDDMFRGI